jgi:hypothetical protein
LCSHVILARIRCNKKESAHWLGEVSQREIQKAHDARLDRRRVLHLERTGHTATFDADDDDVIGETRDAVKATRVGPWDRQTIAREQV